MEWLQTTAIPENGQKKSWEMKNEFIIIIKKEKKDANPPYLKLSEN